MIPHWIRDPNTGYKMVTARTEIMAESALEQDAFGSRRCLIPATGFYEWRPTGSLPYYVCLDHGAPFATA